MASRYVLALLWLVACQPSSPHLTGFGSGPGMTVAMTGTTSEGVGEASSTGRSTGEGGGLESDAGPSTEPARDLGAMPDFGDEAPVGCQGKIDFLFMISRAPVMMHRQEQLALAFPQFIETIESKFSDFDYHIMVVTGDEEWGHSACTAACATPGCKLGDPCCMLNPQNGIEGEPCCAAPDYPCEELDTVGKCDLTWGAGEVFPAGVNGEANKRCPIDGDLRYLVKGQSDLEGTFECIAKVGASGWDALGQGLTAAVRDPINQPGGCNRGFLRKDALLMVTFISSHPDEKGDSEGTPAQWAQAVLDAKYGDARSAVMLNIGGCDCPDDQEGCSPNDRLCSLVTMFPYHYQEDVLVADYGPAFVKAASLVETACAGFTPPQG